MALHEMAGITQCYSIKPTIYEISAVCCQGRIDSGCWPPILRCPADLGGPEFNLAAMRCADSPTRATQMVLNGRSTSFSRSEEHTSELQSQMRTSYTVFCLKK